MSLRTIIIILFITICYSNNINKVLPHLVNNPYALNFKSVTKNHPNDQWIAIDKIQHYLYSCLVSLGCQYVLVNKFRNSEVSALPISSSLSFSAGLFKELNDKRGKNGYFSLKDMVANGFGICTAALIIMTSN